MKVIALPTLALLLSLLTCGLAVAQPNGDDDSAVGDDDSAVGDDDSATGDDDSAAGDDDSAKGDDNSAKGDDNSAKGDDNNAGGDEAAIADQPCPWSLMGCGDDGSEQTQEGGGGAITSADWFGSTDNSKGVPYGYITLLLLILSTGGLMLYFTRQAQRGKEMFIRRMPGIDAIEDGIGRATEMGKPVLYVPGIDDLQDIQTIASMLILGQVSKTIAEYQTELIVSCCVPIVREVADEVVRAGFYQAGYPDAFRPEEIRFIAADQFAFCAGTNGIMLREKPATNIYLGRFFAESLILAETGYLNRSIQIAGTAEATQLPFFVAACDYTLIGEELFAVSAYLSRDPRLVSSLKASDYLKVAIVAALLVGTLMASFDNSLIVDLFSLTMPGD